MRRFLKDQSGKTVLIAAVFGVMISVIFFVSLLPTIVEHVQDVAIIDTRDWNFTGSTGAATIFLLIPFTVIAGYVLSVVLEWIHKGNSV